MLVHPIELFCTHGFCCLSKHRKKLKDKISRSEIRLVYDSLPITYKDHYSLISPRKRRCKIPHRTTYLQLRWPILTTKLQYNENNTNENKTRRKRNALLFFLSSYGVK